MRGSSGFIKIVGTIIVLTVAFLVVTISSIRGQRDESDNTIDVILSVYSGRPDPQWQLEKGEDQDKLVSLIKELELKDEPMFDYAEWNRLGYASFWVILENINGLPYAIHVWRDMAYVIQDKEGRAMYAIGAMDLYDVLVRQAEERDQGKFFVNYREIRQR